MRYSFTNTFNDCRFLYSPSPSPTCIRTHSNADYKMTLYNYFSQQNMMNGAFNHQCKLQQIAPQRQILKVLKVGEQPLGKLILEPPLRKMGTQNLYTMFPINTKEKSPFLTRYLFFYWEQKKNTRGVESPPSTPIIGLWK